MIEIRRAKKYGSSVTLPLTSFIELGKEYMICDVTNNNGDRYIIITEMTNEKIDTILNKLKGMI